jgi:hypothetical protein
MLFHVEYSRVSTLHRTPISPTRCPQVQLVRNTKQQVPPLPYDGLLCNYSITVNQSSPNLIPPPLLCSALPGSVPCLVLSPPPRTTPLSPPSSLPRACPPPQTDPCMLPLLRRKRSQSYNLKLRPSRNGGSHLGGRALNDHTVLVMSPPNEACLHSHTQAPQWRRSYLVCCRTRPRRVFRCTQVCLTSLLE